MTPSTSPSLLAQRLREGDAGNTFLLLAPHLQEAIISRGEALPTADQSAWMAGLAGMDMDQLLALAETPTSRVHVVRRGQTLSGIAGEHHVTLAAVLAVNPQIENADLIHPGQEVKIPAPKPN